MTSKTLPVLALVLTLLVSATVSTGFVNLGYANPYIRDWKIVGTIPPPDGTKPPTISIYSPMNNTAYASNNLLLNFSVIVERSNNISLELSKLNYVASWQKNKIDVDLLSLFVENNYTWPATFLVNMTGVPEGPRWLEINAVATGFAYGTGHEITGIYDNYYFVGYQINSSTIVEFTIDNTAPKILSVLLENKTYTISDIPVTIIANEPLSQVSFSLDGQDNKTVSGNTTLTGLSNGEHIISVYATDKAGITSASKTASFRVEMSASFPIIAIIVMIAVASIIGLSLLIYFKKYRY